MKVLQAGLVLCLLAVVAAEKEPVSFKAAIAKRVLKGDFAADATPESARRKLEEHLEDLDKHPNFRRRHGSLFHHPSDSRREEQKEGDFAQEENCDQALLTCLPEEECAECFRFLYSESIDWARSVNQETSCDDVLKFLSEQDYCADMHDDQAAKDAFCKSYDACAVWEDDEPEDDNEDGVDCDALTECNWEGMHKGWIGDGICQDYGCYNTEVCGYDGGDCCEDSCKSTTYVNCGHEGYICRDPNSTSCDPSLVFNCKHKSMIPDENNPDPADTKCDTSETKYRLVMYDSFGDGWDGTKVQISTNDKKDVRFDGRLETGYQGTRFICLPTASTCIHVEVAGGEWGNEVSWEIKPMVDGARALGAGGAPMSCDFAVGGSACDNTCTGNANIEPNKDPDYKEFKDMYTCIEKKCAIQVGICEGDETCSGCLAEEKADWCYSSDAFLAVVDCTMCSCTDRKDSAFCHSKLNPGVTPPIPNSDTTGRVPDGSPRACSPSETMKGSNAVLSFANCTNFDQIQMLVSDYDQNSFGLLDQFEACSHSFGASDDHGGHTALGCMQILVNAMNSGSDEETDSDNAKAIAALAELLYHNAGGFCECAAKASADCPLCSSFVHLKTLLYESLDACQSLDEIDCAAWDEYYRPCQNNLIEKGYGTSFSSEDACKFVHDGCGGAGPFPAFRRLDCDQEGGNSDAAWEFWKKYSSACLKDVPSGDSVTPKPTTKAPVPVSPPTKKPTTPYAPTGPKPAPTAPAPRPTSKYVPPPDGENKKPYVPSDSSSSSTSEYSSGGEKKSHGWRNFFFVCIIGAAGFYYYKRRSDAFSFVRYRNTRNYAGGESEMYSAPYSGLTMDSGSGVFQPPSLPPTPSAIDGGMT